MYFKFFYNTFFINFLKFGVDEVRIGRKPRVVLCSILCFHCRFFLLTSFFVRLWLLSLLLITITIHLSLSFIGLLNIFYFLNFQYNLVISPKKFLYKDLLLFLSFLLFQILWLFHHELVHRFPILYRRFLYQPIFYVLVYIMGQLNNILQGYIIRRAQVGHLKNFQICLTLERVVLFQNLIADRFCNIFMTNIIL